MKFSVIDSINKNGKQIHFIKDSNIVIEDTLLNKINKQLQHFTRFSDRLASKTVHNPTPNPSKIQIIPNKLINIKLRTSLPKNIISR